MRQILITILLLLPALVCAQDFPFEQEFDSVPVEINEWQVFQPWRTGFYYTTPGFVDLDADGDFDLVIGEWNGNLNLWENTGIPNEALFAYVTNNFDSLVSSENFEWYNTPCFKDIDNDTDPDLFWGNGGRIFFCRNIGSPLQYNFNLEDSLFSYNQDVQNADLFDIDNDGDLDLFAGGYQGKVLFAQNIGTPTVFNFNIVTEEFLSIDVGYFSSPHLCDLDGDNDCDLFIGNSYGVIWYYENIGDSVNYNFADPVQNWLNIDVGDYASPEFCDIDGDGDFDLFVGREPTGTNQHMGDVFYYENIGSPQIPQFQYITSNYLTIDVGLGCINQLVDIDDDDDLDLFVGASDEIRFFRNTGNPSNPAFILQEEYYQNISLESIVPYFCDIDGDNDYDLFAGMGAIPGPPGLHLYTNIGTPHNADFVLTSTSLVPGNFDVMVVPTLADIDADGDYDLFITDSEADNGIWYYQNNGTPTQYIFAEPVLNWQGIERESDLQRILRFHDIDGDDDLDLFFQNNWNEPEGRNLRFYENIGTASNPIMQLETRTYLPFEVTWPCPWFCNIDNDEYTDLFLGEDNGGILFFHGIDDTSSVSPRLYQHPLHGIEMTIGPNPANPYMVARCKLQVASFVDLGVYDICGRLVKPLASEFLLPGPHQFRWDAEDAASGVYVLRLQAGETMQAKRVVVLR